jgi:hypothetical protein
MSTTEETPKLVETPRKRKDVNNNGISATAQTPATAETPSTA